MTLGCSLKPGIALTMPKTLNTRSTLSREPSTWRAAESRTRPVRPRMGVALLHRELAADDAMGELAILQQGTLTREVENSVMHQPRHVIALGVRAFRQRDPALFQNLFGAHRLLLPSLRDLFRGD